MIRVRQGWYVNAGIHAQLMQAVRVGGRASCSSALRLTGLWAIDDGRLHVVVERNDCELRSPDDAHRRLRSRDPVTIHWRHSEGRSRLIADPLSALEDLCACSGPELAAASADAILRRDPSRAPDILALGSRLPRSHRLALLAADGICESGIETIFWLRMRGAAPRRQVEIPGVGRVDFLFGDRLVVEVDGEQFHSGVADFEEDRRRDAALSARGFRVLRFSYRQVTERWEQVELAVRAAIIRGDRF